MNDSTFLSALKWLWDHKPDLFILIIITTSAIWLTGQFNNFDSRLDKTETLCNNINDVQLPAIREDIKAVRTEMHKEMSEMRKQTEERFARVDKDLLEIKAFMIKMDTYLTITAKDYPKGNPNDLVNP